MATLHPSAALIVRADVSISDCVRKMRVAKVGSVLVVSPDHHLEPVGIFTERDLLKNIDQLQHGGYWQKPVGTLMSRKLVTLPVSEIHRACEVMLQNNIRHLPITQILPSGKLHVAGIISMRDLFKVLYEQSQCLTLEEGSSTWKLFKERDGDSKANQTTQQKTLILSSSDESMRSLFKEALKHFKKLQVSEELKPSEKSLKSLTALIYDIDGRSQKDWSDFLGELNSNPTAPFTVVTFSDNTAHQEQLELLEKITSTPKFAVFSKPINLIGVLMQLDPKING